MAGYATGRRMEAGHAAVVDGTQLYLSGVTPGTFTSMPPIAGVVYEMGQTVGDGVVLSKHSPVVLG